MTPEERIRELSQANRYRLLSHLHDARQGILDWEPRKDWSLGVEQEQLVKALSHINLALDALDGWPPRCPRSGAKAGG